MRILGEPKRKLRVFTQEEAFLVLEIVSFIKPAANGNYAVLI